MNFALQPSARLVRGNEDAVDRHASELGDQLVGERREFALEQAGDEILHRTGVEGPGRHLLIDGGSQDLARHCRHAAPGLRGAHPQLPVDRGGDDKLGSMSFKREDLDAGRIDLKGVTTGKRVPLSHPGEILRADFLEPMGMSVTALANAIKVPRSRAGDIALGRRAISADAALHLARYFGTSPEFWVNLQAHYDLEVAKQTSRRQIEKEIAPHAA